MGRAEDRAGLDFEGQLVHLQLHGNRVLTGEAGHADVVLGYAYGPQKPLMAEVAKGVRANEFAYLLHGHVGGDELFFGSHIHAKMAGGNNRRCADA